MEGESFSINFSDYFQENENESLFTCTYTPQQNGATELKIIVRVEGKKTNTSCLSFISLTSIHYHQ